MNYLRCIGAIWLVPVALPVWLFYLLPLWALGWHKLEPSPRAGVALFRVTGRAPVWLSNLWWQWGGHAMPFAVVVAPWVDDDLAPGLIPHELRHTDQWLGLGPLFPVVYVALLLWYGYGQHPLELDAARHARESVGGQHA